MRIRNLTYTNLIYVIGRIQAKGYGFQEAEKIARRLFDNLNPDGKTMDVMIDEVMTKEEYEAEYSC